MLSVFNKTRRTIVRYNHRIATVDMHDFQYKYIYRVNRKKICGNLADFKSYFAPIVVVTRILKI